jgi:hypothetical protein
VGFCDDEDATDALRGELVEGLVDDVGTTFEGGFAHGDLDAIRIIEECAITVIAFHEYLDSKRFHGGEGGLIRDDVNRRGDIAADGFATEYLPSLAFTE